MVYHNVPLSDVQQFGKSQFGEKPNCHHLPFLGMPQYFFIIHVCSLIIFLCGFVDEHGFFAK